MKCEIHDLGEVLLDRYRLDAELGSGGMQEVYRARDLVLERDVAVKVPKNASARRNFQASAVLSARINHPNVAKTLDFFKAHNRFYLVEEVVLGEDLSSARACLPQMDPYLVAHVLHHLAKGVAASHAVAVVHRDLKPNNIMVSPGLTFSHVKITDFGIARMSQEEMVAAVEGGDDTISNSSTVKGAIPYLSPEMVATPREADCPTDIWAIGAIAYELLTGIKPYGRGLLAIPRIIAAIPPTLPAEVTSNGQFADTARAVFGIILRCLDGNVATRATAIDLVSECESLCYPLPNRVIGRVQNNPSPGSYFAVDSLGGSVFFNPASVFGRNPRIGDEVLLSPHAGHPRPRSHPVLALTPRSSAEPSSD